MLFAQQYELDRNSGSRNELITFKLENNTYFNYRFDGEVPEFGSTI